MKLFHLYFEVIIFLIIDGAIHIKYLYETLFDRYFVFIYPFIQKWHYFFMKYAMKIDYQLLINMKLYFFWHILAKL